MKQLALKSTDSLFHLHILAGVCLSLPPQTHTVVSHVHRPDHKHRAGLGPSEKVTQSSAES